MILKDSNMYKEGDRWAVDLKYTFDTEDSAKACMDNAEEMKILAQELDDEVLMSAFYATVDKLLKDAGKVIEGVELIELKDYV